MLTAPTPAKDAERVAALHRYDVLDTPPEAAFDRLAQVLQHVLGVSTVLVSLVDSHRQWFKSRIGLDACETPRDISFCGHVVFHGEPMIVTDATRDPRFADNPLVTGAPHLRFYAGMPLRTADGHVLGTLCAIDDVPRAAPTPAELQVMANLADAVVAALELRRYADAQARRAERSEVVAGIATTVHEAVALTQALMAIAPRLGAGLHFDQCHAYLMSLDDHKAMQRVGAWAAQHAAVGEPPWTLPTQAAETGRIAFAPSTGRDHVDLPSGMGFGWAFPFYVDDHVCGVIALYRCQALPDDERNGLREIACLLAGQLGRLAERERLARLKDDFVNTVSHELRTPLTSIAGGLELLDDGLCGALPPKAARMVKVVHNNSLRLTRLVNDILDIGKVESGRLSMERIVQPLAPLVERAVSELEAYAQSMGVTIVCQLLDQAALAHVDADRFIQVVINLLSNACKFSPAGQTVEAVLKPHGLGWRLSVIDHGGGIPAHFQSRVFERFAQAAKGGKGHAGGTGLGLAIARTLVKLMDGDIGFETATGVGTVFHVDLPKAQYAV